MFLPSKNRLALEQTGRNILLNYEWGKNFPTNVHFALFYKEMLSLGIPQTYIVYICYHYNETHLKNLNSYLHLSLIIFTTNTHSHACIFHSLYATMKIHDCTLQMVCSKIQNNISNESSYKEHKHHLKTVCVYVFIYIYIYICIYS